MKQQLYLTAGAIVLLFSLFLFGRTYLPKSSTAIPSELPHTRAFNFDEYLQKSKQKLTPSQLVYVNTLENSVTRGDVKEQTRKQYISLANFWRDSIKLFEPYANYLSEAAKLDNSEKNLTFAAQLILDSMRGENDDALRTWKAEKAASLFEKAIALDPANDSLRVGLGSCYVYGKGMIGDATETMKGIQQLLQVVTKDSLNMQAQMVLGIGGVISRQYEKAISRLNKVVTAQPKNLEAVSWLADAYAATDNKVNAVKWYEYSKKLVNNPAYSSEVDERIKALK